jgi:hypothetical protein
VVQVDIALIHGLARDPDQAQRRKVLLACQTPHKMAERRRGGVINGDVLLAQKVDELGLACLGDMPWIDSCAVEQSAQNDSDTPDGTAGTEQGQAIVHTDMETVRLPLDLV